MDITPLNMFFSIVFGSFGLAYTIYGRKNNFYFLLAGLTLMTITFFTFDTVTLVTVGVFFILLPFVLTKFFD